jgi:hypothetical protein
MVDRMKDAQDLKLESLFASEEIADNGFSARIQKRLRRQLWVRRLALPVAVVLGGAIAVKPLLGLISSLPQLVSNLPVSVSSNLQQVSNTSLPQLSTVLLGSMLVIVVITAAKMLED